MTLKDLPIGKMATVLSVGGDGALRQHFFGYGNNSKSGYYNDETCSNGRPC